MSGVVGVDVLWSLRTVVVVVVVVVVWSLWTHRGWGRCGRMGHGGCGQRGWGHCGRGCGGCGGCGHCGCGGLCPRPCPLLLLLVGYGGRCQSCDGKMGTELTFDGDNTCCCHHLDNVAMPRRLPTCSAIGAGDVALPHCCHLMVCVVLVVGS